MKLQSRIKLAHDRCVPPAETIARLDALIRPHHDYWLHEETVAEHLHWTAMFIEGLDFRSMGKGVDLASSTAGALAEGAEWLASRETGKLPGYLGAWEHEVPDALPIASLLGHVASATPPVLERIRALDEAYHWVDGWSLIDERALKVPLEYIGLISGPNGKATGNNLEEAIIHATSRNFRAPRPHHGSAQSDGCPDDRSGDGCASDRSRADGIFSKQRHRDHFERFVL